jgi:hypothetical protein
MKLTLFAGIAALVFTGAAQAGDVIISDTVTGTISYGTGYNWYYSALGNSDVTGLFGGVYLPGQLVTLTFTYDATQMASNPNPVDPSYYGYHNDGYGFSSLRECCGGISLTISLSFAGYTFVQAGGLEIVTDTTSNETGNGYNNYYMDDESLTGFSPYIEVASAVYSAPLPFDVANPLTPLQYFGSDSDTEIIFSADAADHGNFDAIYLSNATIAPASPATPEPTTWLLLGTGLIGLATMKFRRSAVSR